MNPKHLTPNIHECVIESVDAFNKLCEKRGKEKQLVPFDSEQDMKDFFTPFYEKVQNDFDDFEFIDFMQFVILELKFGFIFKLDKYKSK